MTKPVDIVSFSSRNIDPRLAGTAAILIAANSCYRRHGADPKLTISNAKSHEILLITR